MTSAESRFRSGVGPDKSRPSSPWVDAEEAATLLGTTAHTLRRLARAGSSPVLARRVGHRWRFSRRDLDRFIAGDDSENER
jgi:excisionase family DNA binding protein